MAGKADEDLLRKMLATIRHRGPNDSGTYVAAYDSAESCVAIGNNRLSIIDLSPAGHQPMCNEDGTIWVAYNGEIYNFPELRDRLIRDGHTFKSHSDTEVLVHLYEQHGADLVQHLDGIFAFAIWDSKSRQLCVCRDRMGVKPLYYAYTGEYLFFASEIKALLVCPEVSAEINPIALYHYLKCLYVPGPHTLFQGILKLPAGHRLRWREGHLKVDAYWDLDTPGYLEDSEEAIAEQLRTVLLRTVKRQMISDVPVGFFLSGGLDSSALVACAAQSHGSKIDCYTIAYKKEHGRFEQCVDDSNYARLVATHFGAEYHEISVEPNVVQLLPTVAWHLDTPVADPAAIATLLISQAAARNVTVLVSGQGADEIFGGYLVHRAHKSNKLLRLIPSYARQSIVNALHWATKNKDKAIGVAPGLLLAFCRFGEKLLSSSTLEPWEQFTRLRSHFGDGELRSLFSAGMNDSTASCHEREVFLNHFERVRHQDIVNQLLYVDAKTFLPDLNLEVGDKLSMAASIEVRVPFLGNEVVDFLLRVPPRLKINGFTQKYILRKAMRGILPKAVLQRRKAAFGLPVRTWLKEELREMVSDLLSESRVRRRGLFDPKAITRIIHDNESGERDYTLQIWSLLTLELWHEAFLDQKSALAAQLAAR